MSKIKSLYNSAYNGKYLPELFLLVKIFSRFKLRSENIAVLKLIVDLEKYNKKSNYYLAKLLTRIIHKKGSASTNVLYYYIVIPITITNTIQLS